MKKWICTMAALGILLVCSTPAAGTAEGSLPGEEELTRMREAMETVVLEPEVHGLFGSRYGMFLFHRTGRRF